MVFHWSPSDSKSSSFLSILTDLNNAGVWMISTCPLIFKSSVPFTKPLEIFLSAPSMNSITVSFILLLLFVCYASSGIFSFYLHQPLKKKIFALNICTLLIQYLYTDQILLSNLSNSSQNCPLKFFFLTLFLKSSNLIKIFFTLTLFFI